MSVSFNFKFLKITVLISLMVLSGVSAASGEEDFRQFSKEEKVVMTTLAGFSVITAWGLVNWDYFQTSPHTGNEGWFSDDTKAGGQDKLGHFFFSYSLSHAFSALYEHYGYTRQKGALYGTLSSFGLGAWMEVGDSFSEYGFSHEDMIMNLLGSAAGYLLYTQPFLAEKIDFRLEYRPRFDEFDFTTDYDRQKFLMAIKLAGFDRFRETPLKYLEIRLGYDAKGYPDHPNRERNLYAEVGLNLSRIFKQFSLPVLSKACQYVQVPYTGIGVSHDLN